MRQPNLGEHFSVKPGVHDEETGIAIGGWSGYVRELYDDVALLEWDVSTLLRMPPAYIIASLDEGLDYERYQLSLVELVPAEEESSPENLADVQQALEDHYHDYELSGIIPPAFRYKEEDVAESTPSLAGSRTALLPTLRQIKGQGTFATSGEVAAVLLGLSVSGVGPISLPILPAQAQALIAQARQAPFGKGHQTITDTAVRNTWEIDATAIRFANPAWEKTLKRVLKTVKKKLGLEKTKIEANLYKLLIYEEGGFFLPHQDSEKEPGMFGTLIIALPSLHTGGELLVRFDGQEQEINFAKQMSGFDFPYAAFYADCEHEVRPVQSGYRIGLVYNLVQKGTKQLPMLSPVSAGVEKLADLLRNIAGKPAEQPTVVLLSHQYTPTNFSLAQLKGNDHGQARALLTAAEQAGYFAKLGLVTHYKVGELLGADHYYNRRGRGRYYDWEDTASEGYLGEVHDEYTRLEYWSEDGLPGLGKFALDEKLLLTDLEIGEGAPQDKEEEGYTGNAGMTMEYWYHYGAVVLWPKTEHEELLGRMEPAAILDWLSYYEANWEAPDTPHYASCAIRALNVRSKEQFRYLHDQDWTPLLQVLLRLNNRSLSVQVQSLLTQLFPRIEDEQWISLAQQSGLSQVLPILKTVLQQSDLATLGRAVLIIHRLHAEGHPELLDALWPKLCALPASAELYQLTTRGYTMFAEQDRPVLIRALIAYLLDLVGVSSDSEAAGEQLLAALTAQFPRPFANQIITPLLLERQPLTSPFLQQLQAHCIADLRQRTAQKPEPPSNWTRSVPRKKHWVWDKLRAFLEHPEQQSFDFRARQALRSDMERALRSVTIDLRMETIRQGSPHILRLTKTQKAYEKALRHWQEDLALLASLE